TATQMALALMSDITTEARTVAAEAKVLAAETTAEAKTLAAESTAEAKTVSAQAAATQQAQLAAIQATADAASTAAAIANAPSPTPQPTWTLTPSPTPFFGSAEAKGFAIPGEYVGLYKEVCLQHDNTGPSPDWYVDRVLVAGDSGYIPFVFDRWIASDKADGSLMACVTLPTPTPTRTAAPTRTPTPPVGPTATFSIGIIGRIFPPGGFVFQPIEGIIGPAMRTYDVLIVTGGDPDAGTGAVVRIRLVGYSGSTDWVTLN
ncbi:MAG: PLAT/LH2 domain-containing protein, partial [Anaerolineae bacterium]